MAKKNKKKNKNSSQNKNNMSIGDKAAKQGMATDPDATKDGPFGRGTFVAMSVGLLIFIVLLLISIQ